jgi:flagellar protein FlbD
MILLTRLNGKPFYLNPHLISTIESTPDTLITLFSDKKIIVRESHDVVVELIMDYRKSLQQDLKEPIT